MFLSVGLQTALGLGAALLLNGPRVRFAALWRTILILPWAIPEFIGALIWMRIYEPRYGWLALADDLPWYIYNPQWSQRSERPSWHAARSPRHGTASR